MVDVSPDRSVSTRFRILVEIASRQPFVQQKDVAQELGVTVQAVSERVKELVAAGLVVSRGRSSYSVTPSGVDWLLRHSREMQSYSERISRIVHDISVTAAVADGDLERGQTVMLEMRHGVLRARAWMEGAASSGTTIARAHDGGDVGVTGIEGVIPLVPTKLVVATIPAVQDGGSGRTDLSRLKGLAANAEMVACAGVESLVSLRLAGVAPDCCWAVVSAVIEAAAAGVQCLLVCSEAEVGRAADRLAHAGLQYSVVDLALPPAD